MKSQQRRVRTESPTRTKSRQTGADKEETNRADGTDQDTTGPVPRPGRKQKGDRGGGTRGRTTVIVGQRKSPPGQGRGRSVAGKEGRGANGRQVTVQGTIGGIGGPRRDSRQRSGAEPASSRRYVPRARKNDRPTIHAAGLQRKTKTGNIRAMEEGARK